MKQRIVFLFCLGILIVISLLSIAKQKNIDVQEIKLLPNLNASEQTVGFTCTGMTYNHLDSCWYIGNIGAYHPNEGMKSSIIVMSKDFKQVEDSILLYKLFPDMVDVQGIAIDETDNSILLFVRGE